MVSATPSSSQHPREERELPHAKYANTLPKDAVEQRVRTFAACIHTIQSTLERLPAEALLAARQARVWLHHELYRNAQQLEGAEGAGLHQNSNYAFSMAVMGHQTFRDLYSNYENRRRSGGSTEVLVEQGVEAAALSDFVDHGAKTDTGVLVEGSRKAPKEYQVYPVVFPHFSLYKDIFDGRLAVFQDYYSLVPAKTHFVLRDEAALLANPAEARAVQLLVECLAGVGSIPLRGYGQKVFVPRIYPLYCGRDTLEIVNGSRTRIQQVVSLVTPFGQLSADPREMEIAQHEVARGLVQRSIYQILGRLHQPFLHWLRGEGVGALGPVPDIEVIYELPLPSGQTFRLSLHQPPTRHGPIENNLAALSGEDKEILSALEHYFSVPENRSHPRIFTDLRRADFDEDTNQLLENASVMAAYSKACGGAFVQWIRSVWSQLLEFERQRSVTVQAGIPPVGEFSEFAARIAERLKIIPHNQNFRPAEFFELNETELLEFNTRYLPQLYEVVQREQDRVARESSADHELRAARGYRGPAGGIPMSLDLMIMDMIFDLRKEQKYRQLKHRDHRVAPESVVIPTHIGRKYTNGVAPLQAADLPGFLSTLPNQRFIGLTLLRPDKKREQIATTAQELPALYERLVSESLAAIHDDVEAFRTKVGKRSYWATMDKMQLFDAKLFLGFYERILASIQEIVVKQAALVTERKRVLRALGDQKIRGEISSTEIQQRQREYADQAGALFEERFKLERRLYTLCSMPFAKEMLQKGHVLGAITDEEIVRLIFSVDYRNVPFFAYDPIDRQGRARRTHPELIGGNNMYAGGESIVGRHKTIHLSFEQWQAFQGKIATGQPRPWSLFSLRGSSGHYQPGPGTLPFAAALIEQLLEEVGINTEGCQVIDHLAGGMFIHELAPFD